MHMTADLGETGAPFNGREDEALALFRSAQGFHDLEVGTVAAIGRTLFSSNDLARQIEGGWALLHAGLQAEDSLLIQEANAGLRGVVRATHGKTLGVSAQLPLAVSAEYRALAEGHAVDPERVASKLKKLDSLVLSTRNENLQRAKGQAPEVATAYLLTDFSAKHPELDLGIVWPTQPWQDRGTHGPHKNFDLILGQRPDTGSKIQVKARLNNHRYSAKPKIEAANGARNFWRESYDEDIFLVFGDLHLGNPDNDPFAINKAIAKPSEVLGGHQRVQRALRNLKTELGIESN